MKLILQKPLFLVLISLLLAPCLLGAENDGGVPGTKRVKLTASEVANRRNIRENSTIGIPHKLNLADDLQYAYVQDMLRLAHRSAQSSPQLFKALAAAHAHGQPTKPAMLTATTGVTLQGINYVTDFGPRADGSFFASIYSTYPPDQVPFYTDVIVTLIDLNTSEVISTSNNPVFSATNVAASSSGTPATPGDRVEVNALFTIVPANGDLPETFNVVITDTATQQTSSAKDFFGQISNACQNAPSYNTTGVQQCQTSTATTCVNNNGNPLRTLKVCYGNRIQSDCDYGCQGASTPTNIIFPIVGHVNLDETPIKPVAGSLWIVLTSTTGGGCILNATASNALLAQVSVNGNEASWNLPPANFPNKACVQYGGMVFDYSFSLFLQTVQGETGVVFTSKPESVSSSNTVTVPQINIVQGCLPTGVKIRMADGSERAIESFQAYGDEKVRSHGTTETRAVTGKTWGHEEKPLVRIRDDRGHTLLLTEAHPVMTARGPVAASRLKKGDGVFTESGRATLVEVSRQPSAAPVPVHNLRVGSEKDAADGQSTFYANGILVGDQLIQQHLMLEAAKSRSLSKAEILRRLPREWHQDFLNSLAATRSNQNHPR